MDEEEDEDEDEAPPPPLEGPRDVNRPTQWKTYHAVLRRFMNFCHTANYPKTKMFTREELSFITPEHIYRWFSLHAYGMENPSVEDNPTEGRGTTLMYYKKALSYFMPNKLQRWTIIGGVASGNPTKSVEVNNLLNAIKKKETRGVGKKSSADRALTKPEFEQVVELMDSNHGTVINRKRYLCMMKFQFHLIGHNDDTAHVYKNTIKRSPQFPDFLTVKMRWSKNVLEEQDCPKQLLTGVMDEKYCVVLALALFLEVWIEDGVGAASQWLFLDGNTDPRSHPDLMKKETQRGKAAYASFMKRNAFMSPNFVRDHDSGNLGTHSVRKFATTFCRSCGGTKDDTDYRARWKARRQQDRYTDTELHWPDICAGGKLCVGGICLYKPVEGSGITDEWLAQSVARRIAHVLNPQVAAILAKPLLWACFEDSMSDAVPANIKREVVASYIGLQSGLPEGTNPIKKVQMIPSESNGQVSFDELVDFEEEDGAGGGGGTAARRVGNSRSHQQWMNAVYAKLCSIQNKVDEVENRQITFISRFERKLQRVETLATRAAMTPISRRRPVQRTTNPGGQGTDVPANLISCPRSLYALWNEYESGVGGNKPAKDFTRAERGKVKHMYSRRLVLWKVVERLISRGASCDEAVHRIYNVYHPKEKTTAILNALKKDERNGGHRLLR